MKPSEYEQPVAPWMQYLAMFVLIVALAAVFWAVVTNLPSPVLGARNFRPIASLAILAALVVAVVVRSLTVRGSRGELFPPPVLIAVGVVLVAFTLWLVFTTPSFDELGNRVIAIAGGFGTGGAALTIGAKRLSRRRREQRAPASDS